MPHACAIHSVTGREIVRAVEDDAARGDQRAEPLVQEALLDGNDLDFRVYLAERLAPGRNLGSSYRFGGVKDLALQVGEVHRVAVGESDRSDPCRGEVQRRGGTEPSRAYDQRRGREQLLLPLDADPGEENI